MLPTIWGRYEIMKYAKEIIETLKVCQDNETFYSQVNACLCFIGWTLFDTGHVDTAFYFMILAINVLLNTDILVCWLIINSTAC